MNHLSLRPIDKQNWETAIELSVKEEQKAFVASNLYSIAEVQFLKDFFVKGVYLDDKMIGFTMYGIDPDDHNYWIYRFMIDQEYQGRGYSKAGIELIIEDIRNINLNKRLIMIGYHPDNLAAKYAYKKVGFVETVVAPWGEQLAEYNL
jgi:diamine N-acetyltransferase